MQVKLYLNLSEFACAVPRWGEVEANGNGSIKDVDRLLRTHKTIVPERDSWCVLHALLLVSFCCVLDVVPIIVT